MPIVYNDPLLGRPREASRIPAPTRDVLEAQFAQTFEENPIAASKRFFELRSQQRNGTHIDAFSARDQLKNAGLENDLRVDDAGITQEALDTLMERKRIEKRRADVFSRAQGGFTEGAAKLGVSMATSLADPIGMGLNFVPVVGQARYARWLNASRSLAGRAAVRAGVGAVEGTVGAAIVEPLIYTSRTAEQADYDAVDSLMNVAFGGVLGTAMHTTVGTLGEVFARSRSVPSAPPERNAATIAQTMRPEDFQAAVRTAVGQAVEGRPIDVDGVVRASEFVPPEERVITREINEALAARESDLRAITEGKEGLAVALRGADDTSERLAKLVADRDADAALIRESENVQIKDEARRLALSDHRNAYALRRTRDQGGADVIFKKWEDRAKEIVTERRAEAEKRVEGANKLIASMQETLARSARVRGSETDLGQLQYARNAARSIDDLVDALPSAQQAGFRRRIAQGRAEGYIRGPGSRLAQPDAAELGPVTSAQPADNVPRETSQYADEVLAREPDRMTTDDVLTAITEEEQLATKALTDLYQRLGRDIKNAEYNEIVEAAKNAERWAKTAELATVCLMRGG